MAGIFVEIIGNASQFKRELDGAVASTARANSSFARMGKAAGVASFAIGGALVIGLAHAAKGAMEDEVANARLAKSFENAHQPIAEFQKRIDAATKAGINLGFHDEQVAESLGSLEAATHSGAAALKLLASVEDVARFKHIDLASASKMVTSTLSGNVRAAKALGIQLIPVTTNVEALRAKYKALNEVIPASELLTAKYADKQATAELAVRKLNDAIGGTADAYVKTSSGAIDVLNAKTDKLSDSMGKVLVPAIKAAVDSLNNFVGFMGEHTNVAKAFTAAIAGLSLSLYAFSVAAAVATGAALPISAPILAAIIAISTLSFIVYKLVTDFKNSWPLLLPIVLGPMGAIIAAVIHWRSQISSAFSAAWNAVKSITTAGINAVLGAIRGAVGAAAAAASAVGHAILNGIMTVINTIDNKVRAAFGAVWAAIRGLAGAALSAGRAIGEAVVRGIISGLTGLAGKAAGIVRDAISHLPHISIPGFSPIEGVGRYIGELVANGMQRGLRENVPKLLSETRGTLQSMANAAGAFANSMFPKLRFIGQRLAFELNKGFDSGKNNLADTLAHQKKNLDEFVASEGIANMADQGLRLGAALTGGFNARTGLASSAPPGGSGIPIVGRVGVPGGTTVNVTVQGSVTTENKLVDAIHAGLLQKQSRNIALGF